MIFDTGPSGPMTALGLGRVKTALAMSPLAAGDEIELDGLLNRQISRVSALEDFINKVRCALEHATKVLTTGHQATLMDPSPTCVHRWQPLLCYEVDDLVSMLKGQRILEDDRSVGAVLGHLSKSNCKILRLPTSTILSGFTAIFIASAARSKRPRFALQARQAVRSGAGSDHQ